MTPDDPRLAPYRAIRDRDHLREGTFIAEGEVVVRRLLTAGRFRTRSLLLDETRHEALRPFLDTLTDPPEVLVAPRSVIGDVAGFPVHRGCLAAVERPPPMDPATLLADLRPRLVLALVGIANHDNMGGLFRNAAAFGVDLVLVDHGSCDPLYRKAIRVSVGAALTVPFARISAEALIPLLEANGLTPLALSPRGRQPLAEVRADGPVALVAGAEGPGLPDAILARCHTVSIPMAAGFDSLNVATATGIALHHLALNPRAVRSTEGP